MVVAVVADPARRGALEAELAGAPEDWGKLVAAIRRILDGERDEEAICEGLDWEMWMIAHTILRGIAEPGSLEALLADPRETETR